MGCGREATRAGIIELLFKRSFRPKKGATIHPTDAGAKALIHSLPEMAARPDMTSTGNLQFDANQRKTVLLAVILCNRWSARWYQLTISCLRR